LPAKLLPWSNLIRKLIGNANGYLPIVLQRNTYLLSSTFQFGKTNDRKRKNLPDWEGDASGKQVSKWHKIARSKVIAGN
jgi:hypothetical protein